MAGVFGQILKLVVISLVVVHCSTSVDDDAEPDDWFFVQSDQQQSLLPVKELLKQSPTFDEQLFTRLLTRNSESDHRKIDVLFLSDINRLLSSLEADFPEMIQIKSIGQSYEKRPINVAVVDAREHLVKTQFSESMTGEDKLKLLSLAQSDLKIKFHAKPSILITGQHHSRETITSSMVLFSLLKMLHGSLHGSERDMKLLIQNKYYVIPTVNVDGLAYIEDTFLKTGIVPEKRTNMDIHTTNCNKTRAGVDLNRNYGYKFGAGSSTSHECAGDDYRGTAAFSEPETQAMKAFLTEHKDDLKFVYNFHCAGKQFIIPFNGEMPNKLSQEDPGINAVINELVEEAPFADGTDVGPSTENIGIVAGGDAGDWILEHLSIPAAEAEIGSWQDYTPEWLP